MLPEMRWGYLIYIVFSLSRRKVARSPSYGWFVLPSEDDTPAGAHRDSMQAAKTNGVYGFQTTTCDSGINFSYITSVLV